MFLARPARWKMAALPSFSTQSFFQRLRELSQRIIHRQHRRQQDAMAAQRLVPLDRLLDRAPQLLPLPRLEEEPKDFGLADGVNDGPHIHHRGDQDARRVRLDFPGLGQKFQAGEHRHLMMPG